jgi:hypothetical protein
MDSILHCNHLDLLFKRGDPFLQHCYAVIDQTSDEDPELVFCHKRCAHGGGLFLKGMGSCRL